MTPRSVAIAHTSLLCAEGIAAALSRYPGIVPVVVATSAPDLVLRVSDFNAAALDVHLPDVHEVTASLRRSGKRVALIGRPTVEDEGLHVPETASIESLARALHPGIRRLGERRTLSPRESEILGLVARGLAAKQVASQLGISPKTVEQHKSRIFTKLGVPNQTAAVSWALSNGLSGSDRWTSSNI